MFTVTTIWKNSNGLIARDVETKFFASQPKAVEFAQRKMNYAADISSCWISAAKR